MPERTSKTGRPQGPDRDQLPSDEDIARARDETEALPTGSGLAGSAAAALGSAMLGLDQAIRREPPAQIVAAEHQPERDQAGDDDGLIIHLPALEPAPAILEDEEREDG